MASSSSPISTKLSQIKCFITNFSRNLFQIQDSIIFKFLPNGLVRRLNYQAIISNDQPNQIPRSFTSAADAMTAFMSVLGSSKHSLRKILITGDFDEFPGEAKMHCTARLAEMLANYSDQLQRTSNSLQVSSRDGLFLMEEVEILEDAKGAWLPNLISRSVFLTLLHRRVSRIKPTPAVFVGEAWDYLEGVVVSVVMLHCTCFPQLHEMMAAAVTGVVSRAKRKGMERMREVLEMEKMADYTCDPDYASTWSELMSYEEEFMEIVGGEAKAGSGVVTIEGLGEVEVGHVKGHVRVARQAFDVRMRLTAYWKVVLRRVVDSVALSLLMSVRNLVNEELEAAALEELMGRGGIQRLLEEPPTVENEESDEAKPRLWSV